MILFTIIIIFISSIYAAEEVLVSQVSTPNDCKDSSKIARFGDTVGVHYTGN